MHISYLKAALPAVILLLLSGCIDKNYDLSDIDTLSQVNVTDLTVPVNIDVITLNDIIDIKEDDKLQKVTDVNGNKFYAFTESGSFSSDPIFIEKVTAKAPTISSATETIYAGATANNAVSYEIATIQNDCSFSAGNVDKSIIKITSAKTNDVTFKITFDVNGASATTQKITYTDLKFQLIKGMTAKDANSGYDAETGIWTVSSYDTSSTSSTFTLTVTGFDFEKSGAVLNTDAHTFNMPGEISLLSGKLTLTPKSGSTAPNSLSLETKYAINDMIINTFCGRLNYALEGMNIDPIDLNNIPDFLSGDDTNLFLSNPQIFLTTNNPVANNKLQCSTGLTLTAKRPSNKIIPSISYSLAAPITIGYDLGETGPYNFVLAPKPNRADINILDNKYATNLNSISFPELSNIVGIPTLYGVGSLPKYIEIELSNPEIVEGDVTDFELGRNISGIDGKYDFVAPVSLTDQSTVVYTKTIDGWNDEYIDAITISEAVITANITNSTPLALTLKAYPVDVDGNRINGVTISSTRIEAGAVDAPVTITLEGTITHLDGITYVATLAPADNGADVALSPSQTITLKDIKAKVSGNFTKEL